MQGPDGEKHWARVDYKTIKAPQYFTAEDSFCDEEGTRNKDFPSMNWTNTFTETTGGT